MKVRGTANQIFDKYVALARDATSAGDRIAAEGYFQHAEHYFRVYSGALEANQARQAQATGQGQNPRPENGDDEDHDGQGATVVTTESREIRESELSDSDIARSEPN